MHVPMALLFVGGRAERREIRGQQSSTENRSRQDGGDIPGQDKVGL